MTDKDYFPPALAALAAAIGLPLLWITDAVRLGLSGARALDGGPGFADGMFLLLGLCMAWAYWALRGALRERLNYRALDVPLAALAVLTVLFHGALFAVALCGWFLDAGAVTVLVLAIWVPFLVLFGLADLAVALILLRDREQLPALFTLLGALSGILGLAEITVLFSVAALVLLPLVLVVLALCLVHRPDYLEVI